MRQVGIQFSYREEVTRSQTDQVGSDLWVKTQIGRAADRLTIRPRLANEGLGVPGPNGKDQQQDRCETTRNDRPRSHSFNRLRRHRIRPSRRDIFAVARLARQHFPWKQWLDHVRFSWKLITKPFQRTMQSGISGFSPPPSVLGSAPMTLTEQMLQLARQARAASRPLSLLTTDAKNRCLQAMACALLNHQQAIQEANARDMEAGAAQGLSSAMLDRLRLDPKRMAAMAQGLQDVAALPDPVGRVLDQRVRPNGLQLYKISTPIGVVVIIYESRPNVTADAAGLCFKSGNATILRGGREAIHSNRAIAEVMVAAARESLPDFPEHAIQMVTTPDRQAISELLAFNQYIDLCMPRGGEGLIRAVTECSKVPVIKHYKGVCHVYVDADADLSMARSIVLNAKLQRPAVCNAIETLLVDRAMAPKFLPAIASELGRERVELRVDETCRSLLEPILTQADSPIQKFQLATEQDWSTEYNDRILNVRIVDGVRQAVEHINQYGSAHSDSIVTQSEPRARQFLAEVDSAAVYWNASTRFTDGGEFGMGAEIGISTDKIGARGPMGLEELTSYKWVGIGTGQIRS
jgi:glutamate-5-semialdehyde dehydrogenase